MTTEELSWEEKNRLYGKSMIPFFVAFVLILVYFNYLMYSDGLKSVWDYIFHIGLLFLFAPYVVAMLSFEVLYSRKVKKRFNFKRFGGRMFFILTSILSLLGFLILTDTILSPIIGDWNTAFLGIVVWLIAFFVVLTRFRHFFTELNEGNL